MAADRFETDVDRALADAQLRKNFAFAMGSFILRRKAVFSDAAETERLRTLGNAIKQRALSRLPELLEQLEASCTRNGIRVHWPKPRQWQTASYLKSSNPMRRPGWSRASPWCPRRCT